MGDSLQSWSCPPPSPACAQLLLPAGGSAVWTVLLLSSGSALGSQQLAPLPVPRLQCPCADPHLSLLPDPLCPARGGKRARAASKGLLLGSLGISCSFLFPTGGATVKRVLLPGSSWLWAPGSSGPCTPWLSDSPFHSQLQGVLQGGGSEADQRGTMVEMQVLEPR